MLSQRICVLIILALPFIFLTMYGNESHVIQFFDFVYQPDELDVVVGDTIIWQGVFAAHPLQSTSVPAGAQHWGPITSGTEFQYVVEVEGTYNYRCTLHDASDDMNGSFTATTVTSVHERVGDIPDRFRLDQNYPNPFNPTTEIRFSLPERMQITLDVYAIHGQKIATIVDGVRDAGHYSVTFDATGMPSGIYVYRLQSDAEVKTRRMVYIR
jgi:plastocyanin